MWDMNINLILTIVELCKKLEQLVTPHAHVSMAVQRLDEILKRKEHKKFQSLYVNGVFPWLVDVTPNSVNMTPRRNLYQLSFKHEVILQGRSSDSKALKCFGFPINSFSGLAGSRHHHCDPVDVALVKVAETVDTTQYLLHCYTSRSLTQVNFHRTMEKLDLLLDGSSYYGNKENTFLRLPNLKEVTLRWPSSEVQEKVHVSSPKPENYSTFVGSNVEEPLFHSLTSECFWLCILESLAPSMIVRKVSLLAFLGATSNQY